MASQFTISALLMAKDKMSGPLKSASRMLQAFGAKTKGVIGMGAGMQLGMSAVNAAIGTISSSLDGAISRFDTLNNFSKVMENLGLDGKKADEAITRIGNSLGGLPTSTDTAAKAVQRFAAKNKDIDKSADYFLALNNAMIAGGASAQEQASAMEQFAQAYSKGKPDMVEWKSLLNAMPGQMDQIATAMGKTTDELGEGLRTGTVSMDDFMATVVKLNDKGLKGFKSFEDQAHDSVGGIATSITGMKTAVVRGIANTMKAIDQGLQDNGLPKLGEMIGMASAKIDAAFTGLNGIVSKVDWGAVKDAAMPMINTMTMVADKAGQVATAIGNFLAKNAATIVKITPYVVGLMLAFSGLLAVLNKKPGGSGGGGGDEGPLGLSVPEISSVTANLFLLGAAVLAVGAGMYLLSTAAINLASAGAPAIALMFGMLGAFTAILVIAAALGPALSAAAVGVLAVGAAFLLMGAGVLLAGAGLTLIASALPIIAAASTSAAAGLVQLAASAMALVAATPVFATAAAALIGLGTAALLAGVGCGTAAKGAAKLAAGAMQASAGITALTASLKLMSVSAGREAQNAMNKVGSALSKGASKARSLGANLSRGFAVGMRSALGSITSAANAIVAQAERVIRAKAQIRSPSRLTAELGNYFGQGFANGIAEQISNVKRNAAELVQIPSVMAEQMDAPVIKTNYVGTLSGDYTYGGQYSVEVPLYVNGREFAKATSDDFEKEMDSKAKKHDRRFGKV